MAKRKTTVAFSGTPEQEARLRDMIQQHKDMPGALMPVLQKAQEIYGYLPIEVQEIIARELQISVAEVYGVVSFYAQFCLNPKGRYEISVCLGTACYVKGSDKVMEKIQEELGIVPGECTEDGMFSLSECRCVGACGLAPVMMIDDKVYGKMTPGRVPEILDLYRNAQ